MISAANGRFDAVKMMIDAGADSALHDDNHSTAADLASGGGHDAVASLLRHHNTLAWDKIKATESKIIDLRRDSMHNDLSEYDSLLESKKFNTLKAARLDFGTGNELIWFRATENCSIGLDDSGSIIWMFDQVRASHHW